MKLVGWEQLAPQGVPRWQVHKRVAGGSQRRGAKPPVDVCPAPSLRRTQCTNFWVVYNCVLSEFWDRAHLWTTRGRPYKFATGGNRSALMLAGLVPSAGLSARPAHAAGGTLRQRGAFHAGCYAQGTLTQREFRQCCFF